MPAGLPVTRAFLVLLALGLPVVARLPLRAASGGHAHVVLAGELAALLVAAALAFAAWRARPPADRGRLDAVDALVLALVALEGLAVLGAPNGWAAVRASSVVLAGAVTFTVARRAGDATSAVLAVTALVAASVIAEAFVPALGLSRSGHAPGGLLGQRNAAAELLVCTLPLVAHAATTGARATRRALASGIAGLALVAIVLTRTRSAWLAVAVLAALGLALAVRTSDDVLRARAGRLVVALVAACVFAVNAPTKLAWSGAHPYRETAAHLVDGARGSGEGRLAQYRGTLRLGLAHPVLGVGPGNWAGRYLEVAEPGDASVGDGLAPTNRLPSSDVLGFFAERGVPSTLVALALAAALARGRDPRRWLRRATLLAVLVVGSLDAALQLAPLLVVVAWVLGSSVPARRTAGERVVFAGAGLTAGAGAALAACRVAAFVVATRPSGPGALDRAAALDPGDVPLRLAAAATWIEAGDCARAEPHLARVARVTRTGPAVAELAARCRPALTAAP